MGITLQTPEGILSAEIYDDDNFPSIHVSYGKTLVAIIEIDVENRKVYTDSFNDHEDEPKARTEYGVADEKNQQECFPSEAKLLIDNIEFTVRTRNIFEDDFLGVQDVTITDLLMLKDYIERISAHKQQVIKLNKRQYSILRNVHVKLRDIWKHAKTC